ncbi:hypothetical protein HanRHA438_Chr12g0536051 [Helianthus annuus]|nr:hypothetical protein HanRHA438_Chr12g0536051 [Helianthus annuus]
MVIYSTSRPFAARRNPITAPDRNATMKALLTPFLASRVVLAFAYVAIFIPRKPETTEVMAPSKNDTVLNTAVIRAGLHILVVSYVHVLLLVLNPSTEPRNTKIRTAKMTINTPTYWYSVNRKEVAPAISKEKLLNRLNLKNTST